MTDDQMDGRLRAAGETWRKAATLAEADDQTEILDLGRTKRAGRSRWLTITSAAAVAAAIVAGAIVIAATRPNHSGTAAAANGTNPNAAPASLTGTKWQLENVISAQGDDIPTASRDAVLNFDRSGGFTANDLCNTLSGSADIGPDTITFGPARITLMACLDKGFAPATAVIDVLVQAHTVHYALRAGGLIISLIGSPESAIYRPKVPTQVITDPDQLVGHQWTLTGTQTTSSSGNSSTGSGSSAIGLSVLTFDGNGAFTVRHRCYANGGNADLAKGQATLSDVKLTEANPCPYNAESKDEDADNAFVDNLLTGDVSWSIDAAQLTISKNGRAAIFEEPTATPTTDAPLPTDATRVTAPPPPTELQLPTDIPRPTDSSSAGETTATAGVTTGGPVRTRTP